MTIFRSFHALALRLLLGLLRALRGVAVPRASLGGSSHGPKVIGWVPPSKVT